MKRPNLMKAAEAGLVLGVIYGVMNWLFGEDAWVPFALGLILWGFWNLLKMVGVLTFEWWAGYKKHDEEDDR